MLKKGTSKTYIGENSFFEGKFYIPGELELDGKIESQSVYVDSLTVGKKGKIKSNIKGNSIIVNGIVIGNINAKEKVVLETNAKVIGNIKAPKLNIEDGVLFEGKVSINNSLGENIQEFINKLYEEK